MQKNSKPAKTLKPPPKRQLLIHKKIKNRKIIKKNAKTYKLCKKNNKIKNALARQLLVLRFCIRFITISLYFVHSIAIE